MTASLPALCLSDALAAAGVALHLGVGGQAWWTALHTALAAPHELTDGQHGLLPEGLADAITADDADATVEAWLDDPAINDQLWSVGLAEHGRHIVAHLVLAASQGAPEAIAELLLRDLLRMSALSADDDPLAIGEQVGAVHDLAARLGVRMTPFRDLYDVLGSPAPWLEVAGVCRAGVTHRRAAVARGFADAAPGEVLVIDAGDLYDRQVMSVERWCPGGVIEGRELVSGLWCIVQPSLGVWLFAAGFDRGEVPAMPVRSPRRRRS